MNTPELSAGRLLEFYITVTLVMHWDQRLAIWVFVDQPLHGEGILAGVAPKAPVKKAYHSTNA